MKNITMGIVAHVDSGKTTLSEAILYKVGYLKEYGRVDSGDCFLDTDYMERKRGITIFSKQANFSIGDTYISMLDTPGHVDFSAEMERTLQVLDYAILVISATDGIKAHTKTLWRLLEAYNIPTFIFVNKMDMPDCDKKSILNNLKDKLNQGIIDFSEDVSTDRDILEEIALLAGEVEEHKHIFDDYLDNSFVSDDDIKKVIVDRVIFPCFFGSALKLQGIDELIKDIDIYSMIKPSSDSFGAKVFKITRDEKGNRLVHLKVTNGELSVRDQINLNEKINQIRIYSGEKYETVDKAYAGMICTVTGLASVFSGEGLGTEEDTSMKLIEPILSYELLCPPDISRRKIYPDIKLLEEEFTELSVEWIEELEQIKVKIMGEVQIEILQSIIKDRFGFVPDFGVGEITYKETIENTVIGVGHFEPLRHYAEAHILMEPGEVGSGITVSSDCSEDILDRNWQRLIMTHIRERSHLGVLTGSELTDVKFTVINGRAHNKHTEGGDFRQATYRAIRQGLMEANSLILEPYYDFVLTIPSDMLGRAMTDMDNMHGTIETPEIELDRAIIKGRVPVATIRDYQINLRAYTKGQGELTLNFCGYFQCHNQSEVIETIGYNPDEDISNPSSSVFCSHGAGVIVPWYEVKEHMHVFDDESKDILIPDYSAVVKKDIFDYSIGTDEIDEILSKTYEANQRSGKREFKKKKPPEYHYNQKGVSYKPKPPEKMLIVDGYNVIFAWDELKDLSNINITSAKDKLIQILSNYKGITEEKIILVFDGYKVKENKGEESVIDDIFVVHTKEGQTADNYIEQFAHNNREKYNITVASSDGMIQQITRGLDCSVISSRELDEIIKNLVEEFRNAYNLN